MELWNKGMESTDSGSQPHDCVQAFRLLDGSLAWCLAIKHPSRFFSWRKAHQLITVFLNDPRDAAVSLREAVGSTSQPSI
jgi:hypothetical protein